MGNPRVLRQLSGRLKRPVRPDPKRLRAAVAEFLVAAGVDTQDAELADTPERVAQTWLDDFLDGYGRSPGEVLGRRSRAPGGGRSLVMVTGLAFHSVCPHHLLPWEGVAHLAYVPGESVVGFGRLSALLDVLAHRLVLQETLAHQVADALHELIPSRGAACILEGRQGCLALRGARQRHARTHAEAYTGVLRDDGPLRRELWRRIAKGER